jgi:hypothetical protein
MGRAFEHSVGVPAEEIALARIEASYRVARKAGLAPNKKPILLRMGYIT